METPCSERARAEGEPLEGSAGRTHALIAVAWPKPLWDPEEAGRSRGLPPGLRTLIDEEKREGRKLALRLFQRRPRPRTDRVEVLGLRASDLASWHAEDLALEALVERVADFARGGPVDRPLVEPTLLVCTDGRHDRCCARWGRAFYEAAGGAVRGPAVGLAESSHLGGHRFAATALALPAGILYGRLRPEDAPHVCTATGSGAVFGPGFRGRIGDPEPVQAAEGWCRAADPEATPLTISLDEVSGSTARVRAAVGAREVVIECGLRSFAGSTSCGERDGEPRSRWVVVSARDADPGGPGDPGRTASRSNAPAA